MVGLLARETLELSLLQQCVLVINAALWLTGVPRIAGLLPVVLRKLPPLLLQREKENGRWALAIVSPLPYNPPLSLQKRGLGGEFFLLVLVTLSLLLWAFWDVKLCFDTQLTWEILTEYRGRLISLKEIGLLGHLRSNPPTWGWYVSLIPNYAVQQLLAVCLSLLILGLCRSLYDDWLTRLIAATPLFQLCCTQPLPALYALACLLAARRCWQLGWRWPTPLFLLTAICWKYTVYILLPYFFWTFRLWSLPVIGGLIVYWLVFALADAETCMRQADYLIHTFSGGLIRRLGPAARHSLTVKETVRRSAAWRLPRFLRSVAVLPWYTWPLLGNVPWLLGLLAVGMVLGGGNLKYLLPLIALFPDQRKCCYSFS